MMMQEIIEKKARGARHKMGEIDIFALIAAALSVLVCAGLCLLSLSMKGLWEDTLQTPVYILHQAAFTALTGGALIAQGVLVYGSIVLKDRYQLINLGVSALFGVLVCMLFFAASSALGSFAVLIVHITQNCWMFFSFKRRGVVSMLCSLAFTVFLIYCAAVVYGVLMLN